MTWHRLPGGGRNVRLVAVVCVAALAGCGSSATGPRTPKVEVLLTDAPSDVLDSAQVWISRVYLQGGGGSQPDTTAAADTATAHTVTADRVDLFNDPASPREYDLLTLRDSLEADVTGLVPVNAGTYQALRFVVDSARVTLEKGYTFGDGTTSAVLMTPSADTSGIEVKLSHVLVVDDGQDITVTVDFNVDANFVVQTDQQTGQVGAILFTPVLTEKDVQMTAP